MVLVNSTDSSTCGSTMPSTNALANSIFSSDWSSLSSLIIYWKILATVSLSVYLLKALENNCLNRLKLV